MTTEPLNGARYLEHLRRSGADVPDLGDRVVLALHPAARHPRARQLGGPFGAVEKPRFGSGAMTVAPLGPGPAVAAMTIELLAGLGVVQVVAVGVASRVWPDGDPPNSCATFVVDSAVTDDSVSIRYGGHMIADSELTRRLGPRLGAGSCDSFSTATPFRVDVGIVLDSGAGVVDMEAAALFSAAAEFGISVGLAVVTSDSTTPDGWIPGDAVAVRSRVGEVAASCHDLIGAST